MTTTVPVLTRKAPGTRSGASLQRLLTRRRAIAYGRICVVALMLMWGVWLLRADGLIVAGKPVGGDFVTFYAASDRARTGDAAQVYDLEAMHAAETRALGADGGSYAWHYPPTFLLAISGLALLPYVAAMAVWLAVTGVGLLLAVHARLRDEAVLLLALAFPGVYQNLITGQTGFLSAALLGGGLVLLPSRPIMGGALLGLLTYKPHLAPLVFLALLAGRSYRALGAAIVSSAAAAGLSLLVFGVETWSAFFENIPEASRLLYEDGLPLHKMTSVSASLLMLGLPAIVVETVQALAILAAAAFVVALWRSLRSMDLRAAGLCFAVLLAAPFAFDYDTVILGAGLLFFYRESTRTGWRPWETEAFALAWLSPFLVIIFATLTGIGFYPAVLGALVWLTWRRLPATEGSPRARNAPRGALQGT